MSAERPEPFSLSFMLNAGMETNDILGRYHLFVSVYACIINMCAGLCFNFFIKVQATAEEVTDTTTHSSCPWSLAPPEHPCAPSGQQSFIYTAITICLLCREPFLAPLQRCMQYAYAHYVLPCIEEWETKRDQHLLANGNHAYIHALLFKICFIYICI